MKKILTLIVCLSATVCFTACDNNTRRPTYDYDDPFEVTEVDENTYNYGSITMYTEDGDSRTFKVRSKNGARCIYYDGEYYKIDGRVWITIDGVKYKCGY